MGYERDDGAGVVHDSGDHGGVRDDDIRGGGGVHGGVHGDVRDGVHDGGVHGDAHDVRDAVPQMLHTGDAGVASVDADDDGDVHDDGDRGDDVHDVA